MSHFVEEAYLLGLLFARGKIELSETKRGRTEPYGKYIIRIPIHRYHPDTKKIISHLLKTGEELTGAEIIENGLVSIKGVTPQMVGAKLGRIKNYKPPDYPTSKRSPASMLVRDHSGKWKIHNKKMAEEYLKWQDEYMQRSSRYYQFVIEHLQPITSSFTSNPKIDVEPSSFDVMYHVLTIEVTNALFKKINRQFNLEVGDVYKYIRIPKTFEKFDLEDLEEFVRGFADASSHFDRSIFADPKNGLWQVRFGILHDAKAEFVIDMCQLLQEWLGVPVLSINWAEVGDGGGHSYRESRDHHIIIFVLNIADHFTPPLFYNEFKQEELESRIAEDKALIKKLKIKETPNYLKPCPRVNPRKQAEKGFRETCKQLGCGREYVDEKLKKVKRLDKF